MTKGANDDRTDDPKPEKQDPKAWLDRLADEREDLAERVGRIQDFIGGSGRPQFLGLDLPDRQLLTEQRDAMVAYLNVLDRRIARFEDQLPPKASKPK